MQAIDFQSQAELLVQEASPASVRSAISRSYYGAFNFAVETLDGLGVKVVRNADGHDKACKYLRNSGDDEARIAAESLRNLRAKRNRADYELTRTDIEHQGTAETLVVEGRSVIDALRACCAGARGQQIAAGIQAYRRQTNQ